MAIVKHIRDNSGSGKEFESITTSEITYDTTPQVGSFNPVVSDGIAKALEVATEIPVVTSETAGKVLTASWDSETSTGSTEWGEAPSGSVVIEYNSSHAYTSEECAALAAQVLAATGDKKPVYVCDVSSSNMYPPRYALLSFAHWGPDTYTEYVFVAPTTSATASAAISGYQNSNPNGAIYRLTRSAFTSETANVRSLPTTDIGTLGKVLGVTDANGTLGWVDQQDTKYTAGDGIEITANEVSVNVGTGLSINSPSPADMTLKAIKRDGKYMYIGQLTAQAVAAIKGNASLAVTVLGDYTIEPNVFEFNDARIAILPGIDGGRLPDVSAAKAILSTTNIRSSFVAGSGTGQYTMPANTQVTVDFSNPTIGSNISWSAVEANPTNYLLVIVGNYYGTLYGSAYSNAAGGDPEQKDVVTIKYTVGDNSLQVANPVPSYTTSEDGKVLGVVDNSGTAELQWVEQQTVTAGDGIEIDAQNAVSVKAGRGLEMSDKWGTSESCDTGPDGLTSILLSANLTMELLQNIVSGSGTSLLVGDSGMTWGPTGSGYHWFVLDILEYPWWEGVVREELSTFAYKEEGRQAIGPVEIDWANASSTSPVSSILASMTTNDVVLLYEKYGDGTTPSGSSGEVVGSGTYTVKVASPTGEALSVAEPVPSYTTSEDGKVLGVVDNSGTAELQWVDQQDTKYTAGDGINITGTKVSVKAGTGLSIDEPTWSTPETISGLEPGDEAWKLPCAPGCNAAGLLETLDSNGTGLLKITCTGTPSISVTGDYVCNLGIYDGSLNIIFNMSSTSQPQPTGSVLPMPFEIDWAGATVQTGTISGALAAINNSSAVFIFVSISVGGHLVTIGDHSENTYSVSNGTPGAGDLNVTNPLPDASGATSGQVLTADGSGGSSWQNAPGTAYVSGSSASVSLSADNTVVTNSVDVTSITVGAGVKSAVVQWVVDSTTTLPTVTDGTNALKANANNPAGLTVGKTYQLSILNDCYTIVEFG